MVLLLMPRLTDVSELTTQSLSWSYYFVKDSDVVSGVVHLLRSIITYRVALLNSTSDLSTFKLLN